MAERLAVSWQGSEYEVVRRDGAEAMPEPGPVWQVTRDGAPITYKAWVCSNPNCGFNLRIDNGEISLGRGIGVSSK